MKANSQVSVEWHKQYDNVDGTAEMFMGLMLLGFAWLSYLQSILPKDSVWRTNGFASLMFMYLVLASVMGPGYLIRWIIKRRITFPRTGYVALGVGAHHSDQNAGGSSDVTKTCRFAIMSRVWLMICKRVLVWFIAAAAGAAVIVAIAFIARPGLALPWLTGITYLGHAAYLALWPVLYAFFISRIGGKHRWKWLMVLLMTAGLILIGLLGPENIIEASRPVSLFVGLIWIASGIGTFLSYLRHTRSPVAEAE